MQHLAEVMSAAIEWEAFQVSGPHKPRNTERLTAVADGDQNTNALVQELTKKVEELEAVCKRNGSSNPDIPSSGRPRQGDLARSAVTCYYCLQAGHRRSECPSFLKL